MTYALYRLCERPVHEARSIALGHGVEVEPTSMSRTRRLWINGDHLRVSRLTKTQQPVVRGHVPVLTTQGHRDAEQVLNVLGASAQRRRRDYKVVKLAPRHHVQSLRYSEPRSVARDTETTR